MTSVLGLGHSRNEAPKRPLGVFRLAFAASVLAAAIVIGAPAGSAAELPKETQAFLKQLNLTPDILKDLDKELAVPQAWIDGAKKSPTLKITSSDDAPLHARFIKPFLERYPFIKIQYQRGSANERVIKPLIAYREGRYVADVIRSMDGSMSEFTKINAAEDLSDLPALKDSVAEIQRHNGLAVAFRSRPYCMAYNTKLVKKEQLPKTWDDLLTTTVLANGRIGAVNLPHLWMMPLWGKFGEAWATKYLDDFFTKLQPQIRSEGINATTGLVAAGELYASLPAYPERIKEMQDKGGPVAWHCPGLIPLNLSSLAVLRGTPGVNGAKLYANWLLSIEGQIAQLAVFHTPSIHKDLQSPEFHVFPDEIRGKQMVTYDDEADTAKFIAMWNKYAYGVGQGPARK
jgi:iron(III) transport system substrate-binding protein